MRDLWASQRVRAKGSCTLLHGDTHVGNTYLLVTALDPETRRKHERELIGFYLDALRRHGLAEPPAADEAWRCHRLAVLWVLVIGWLITPPVNYGPAITEANLLRLVTACEDLEAFELPT